MRLGTLCTIPTLGVLLLVGHVATAQDASYTVTTFDVPGASYTSLRGIVRDGLFLGAYKDENTRTHGFLYRDGILVPLDFPNGFDTEPWAINDRGDIVGQYNPTEELPPLFVRGFIYSGGVFRTLAFPDEHYTVLTGINNRGEVVGFYWTPDNLFHSFVYADNVFTPLAVPNARLTIAQGINDRGEIVGWYQDYSLRPHGFVYAQGEFTTFDVPTGSATLLSKSSNSGQIAGLYDTPEPAPPPGSGHNYRHGFVYAHGAFTRLDAPGAAFTEALGLNEAGIVVGDYFDSGGWHGFIATPTKK